MIDLGTYSDEDFKRTMWSALRMVAIAVAVGVPLLWWKLGWASAALFAVGALISGSGLFEWLHLMTALMARMDAGGEKPVKVRPLGRVLTGFVLRLGCALALLYVSLKYMHGSVYALIAGLALAVAALTIEGLRLLRRWTV
jgi:TRAP-type C4-dicarboxylate transport system permease small subunit